MTKAVVILKLKQAEKVLEATKTEAMECVEDNKEMQTIIRHSINNARQNIQGVIDCVQTYGKDIDDD
jgi:hypothetical protein